MATPRKPRTTPAGAASPCPWDRDDPHSPVPAMPAAHAPTQTHAPAPAAATAAGAAGATGASRSASPSPSAPAAPAAPATAPATLSEDDAAALLLHGDAKRAWADIEAGAVAVPRDVASAVLLRYSRHADGVREPLERLMLLVDKLKADVNAQVRLYLGLYLGLYLVLI